jgi:hypothetical protein
VSTSPRSCRTRPERGWPRNHSAARPGARYYCGNPAATSCFNGGEEWW